MYVGGSQITEIDTLEDLNAAFDTYFQGVSAFYPNTADLQALISKLLTFYEQQQALNEAERSPEFYAILEKLWAKEREILNLVSDSNYHTLFFVFLNACCSSRPLPTAETFDAIIPLYRCESINTTAELFAAIRNRRYKTTANSVVDTESYEALVARIDIEFEALGYLPSRLTWRAGQSILNLTFSLIDLLSLIRYRQDSVPRKSNDWSHYLKDFFKKHFTKLQTLLSLMADNPNTSFSLEFFKQIQTLFEYMRENQLDVTNVVQQQCFHDYIALERHVANVNDNVIALNRRSFVLSVIIEIYYLTQNIADVLTQDEDISKTKKMNALVDALNQLFLNFSVLEASIIDVLNHPHIKLSREYHRIAELILALRHFKGWYCAKQEESESFLKQVLPRFHATTKAMAYYKKRFERVHHDQEYPILNSLAAKTNSAVFERELARVADARELVLTEFRATKLHHHDGDSFFALLDSHAKHRVAILRELLLSDVLKPFLFALRPLIFPAAAEVMMYAFSNINQDGLTDPVIELWYPRIVRSIPIMFDIGYLPPLLKHYLKRFRTLLEKGPASTWRLLLLGVLSTVLAGATFAEWVLSMVLLIDIRFLSYAAIFGVIETIFTTADPSSPLNKASNNRTIIETILLVLAAILMTPFIIFRLNNIRRWGPDSKVWLQQMFGPILSRERNVNRLLSLWQRAWNTFDRVTEKKVIRKILMAFRMVQYVMFYIFLGSVLALIPDQLRRIIFDKIVGAHEWDIRTKILVTAISAISFVAGFTPRLLSFLISHVPSSRLQARLNRASESLLIAMGAYQPHRDGQPRLGDVVTAAENRTLLYAATAVGGLALVNLGIGIGQRYSLAQLLELLPIAYLAGALGGPILLHACLLLVLLVWQGWNYLANRHERRQFERFLSYQAPQGVYPTGSGQYEMLSNEVRHDGAADMAPERLALLDVDELALRVEDPQAAMDGLYPRTAESAHPALSLPDDSRTAAVVLLEQSVSRMQTRGWGETVTTGFSALMGRVPGVSSWWRSGNSSHYQQHRQERAGVRQMLDGPEEVLSAQSQGRGPRGWPV